VSVPTTAVETAAPAPGRMDTRSRMWLYLLAGFVLVALVRVVSGANDVDSAGTLRAALESAIPIALAGLGGLWSERAGVVNIGLEGMMIAGTLGAGYFGYHYGAVAGILGAVLFGALVGALHAMATVTFGVDHIVSGVAINIIALGVAGFLAESFFSALPGGGPTQSPELPSVTSIDISFLSDPATTIQNKHWFLVSDLASVVGALTKELSLFTVFALLLIAGTGWLLWKTSFGLRLRSVGESPAAAESLGVDVYRYKFIAVVVSGAMAGLAGAFLAMVASSGFQQGQTNGRGYIGLAAMIFGNWRPGGMLLGSSLFGYTQAMQLRSGGESLHALLLVVFVILLAVAALQLVRKNRTQAVLSGLLGVLFLVWYLSTDKVPREFTTMAPYVTTLLVLAFAAQKLRMPAADGRPYRKGSAG